MLRATFGEDAVAETLSRRAVEDSLSFEHREGIGIEHLGPFVTVVSCRIATSHDVRELYRHAGVGQLLCDDGIFPGVLLEGDDILGEWFLLCVVSHVEQAEAHLSHTGVSHIEVAALLDALDKLVRDGFTGLVMEREGVKEFRLYGVVLHEL